ESGQRLPAFERDDLRVAKYGDALVFLDAIDQVARHAGAEIGGADDDGDLGRRLREKHRGLPRRVAAAGDDDLCILVVARFELGCRVVDARTLELREAFGVEPTITGAGGNDHRAA